MTSFHLAEEGFIREIQSAARSIGLLQDREIRDSLEHLPSQKAATIKRVALRWALSQERKELVSMDM